MSEQSAKMTHLLNFFKVNGKSPATYSARPPLAAANTPTAGKPKMVANAHFDEWEEF